MITPELIGRLGNQMFQYAVARIIAEKNGYNFYISKDKSAHDQNISEFFNLDMGIDDGNQHTVYQQDSMIQKFDPNIFHLPDGTKISGFFQTEKYFDGYEDKVKTWFNFDLTNKTKELLNQYDTNEYCFIHFRGTDYKHMTDWWLPFSYYQNAMNKIKEIKPDIKFLIITDNSDDAREYFDGYDILSNDLMTDFGLLYMSKYCIIPNSSFSWWAAWLSDDKEIIIAPDRWFNYNNRYLGHGFIPVDIMTKKFTYI
jgi:hypothetical protein